MLAARVDQENFVHGQQTAAAAKPLNQGVRGLNNKTPAHRAPRTPFKVPLNDENTTYQAGKTFLKTNGKVSQAFVTPGPTARRALGAKTTNAKANAFFTPAPKNVAPSPQKTQQKTGSPRLRRGKIKVLQSEPIAAPAEDDVDDIEFMPHGDEPHKYCPSDDEFGPNKQFPQLLPENIMKGWQEVYMNPQDGNGNYLSDIRRAENAARLKKINDAKMQKQMDALFDDTEAFVLKDLGLAPAKKESTTTLSRKAASALAGPAKPARKLVTNATSTVKSRAPTTALNMRKARQPAAPPAASATNPSSTRFAAANAASRNTLGYAQGRAISQKVRKPLTAVFKDSAPAAATSPTEADFDTLARDVVSKLRMQDRGDDSDDEDLCGRPAPIFDDDDDFQLPLPTA